MATITKKMIRGKPYYYARECKRVNGKPKSCGSSTWGGRKTSSKPLHKGLLGLVEMPKAQEAIIADLVP